MTKIEKIMLLGSGELGKEFVISAKRLGRYVVAVDSYDNAPAMQVADAREVLNMLDPDALEAAVKKHQPDIIVPEVEAICTEKLAEFEQQGLFVVPNARAVDLTMNRDAIRDLAANQLQLKTAKYAYAQNLENFKEISLSIGFPNVVKPVMSSSGKGQSVVHTASEMEGAWKTAIEGARGDTIKVIVEEFIPFDLEITVLTVRQKQGPTLFVPAIGHRQERGDYQESWIPAQLSEAHWQEAKGMAQAVTDHLGGVGLFGVEFFISKENGVYFSEFSPRPHDTGMVTMVSQSLSEFDLHIRAILGLPIPELGDVHPSASHVVLADRNSKTAPTYNGLEDILSQPNTEVRIFGKPSTRPNRRMAVVLAKGKNTDEARQLAAKGAKKMKLEYHS